MRRGRDYSSPLCMRTCAREPSLVASLRFRTAIRFIKIYWKCGEGGITRPRKACAHALVNLRSLPRYGFEPRYVLLKFIGNAERAGFEPAIPFRVYTLSRRAPSATRTPLQFNFLDPV